MQLFQLRMAEIAALGVPQELSSKDNAIDSYLKNLCPRPNPVKFFPHPSKQQRLIEPNWWLESTKFQT